MEPSMEIVPKGPPSEPAEAEGNGSPTTNNNNNNNPVFDTLFTTTRPRDACAGTYDGVMNVFSGVGTGISTIIIAPVVGALDSGVGGAVRGTLAGVVLGTALTVTGAITGISQVHKGQGGDSQKGAST
jgi:hypothetical protein